MLNPKILPEDQLNFGGFEITEPLPLLTSKLYCPPVTPDLVRRDRLIMLLERNRQSPLTLISAPAGYGKSVLARTWLHSCECPSAWISLQESDNDLVIFLRYLLAALRHAFPTSNLKTQALLDAPRIPDTQIVTRYLINDLIQLEIPFILALDDLHSIQDQAIYDLLAELLHNPAPNMHMLLISRSDPPLPIASLRASQKMTEIRAHELRFTTQETSSLLHVMLEREVSEAIAAEWTQKTEGWVSALRLAVLSLRRRGQQDNLRVPIHGDSRYLQDYLLAEVLARLPQNYQDWLIKTAILDHFCAPLCEAVCRTGSETTSLSGESFIKWLVGENLFLIPLDDRHKWFRFHHLFQETLLHMLSSHSKSDELAAMRLRASRWFAENNLIDEAIQYALDAGDVKAAVQLFIQHRYTLMNTEKWHRLRYWLALLPAETVAQNPLLMSTKLHIAAYAGQDEELIRSSSKLEQLLVSLSPESVTYEIAQSELAAFCAIRDIVEIRKIPGAIQLAQSSLNRLPQRALHVRAIALGAKAIGLQMQGDLEQGVALIRNVLSEDTWPIGLKAKMWQYLCTLFLHEGDLTSALSAARTGLEIAEKSMIPETISFCRYHLGVVHYLSDELSKAEQYLLALFDNRESSAPLYVANGSYVLGLIYQQQGRMAEAVKIINVLESHFQEIQNLHALGFLHAFRIELLLRNGDMAKSILLSKSVKFDRIPIWFFYVPQLTGIKLLLAEGTSDKRKLALTRLKVLEGDMRKIYRKNVLIEVLALQALVYDAQGDEPRALEKLKEALVLGLPGGNIRSFVDLGDPMVDLLLRLRSQESSWEFRHYIDRILAAFPKELYAGETNKPAYERPIDPTSPEPLLEPLTRREQQILSLLATDRSLQEIAGNLHIASGTVYSHTKNIYSKLYVHKRREAVQRGRELGII